MNSRLIRQPLSWPQRLRVGLAIAAGRLTSLGLRAIGRGATALPGKLALGLDPLLLARLTADRQVFLVTGTNGKTTTVRMLCTILKQNQYTVITNPSGANLDSGLTTTLLDHLKDLRQGKDQAVALVFEIDEAFFGKLAASLNPSICVVTNFFRDQLDRFGELQHTRDLIAKGLAACKAKAVLCADDSLCASLGRDRQEEAFYFGMDKSAMQPQSADVTLESQYCSFCGARYQYTGMAYGHLGDFHCPRCGYSRPEPNLLFRAEGQPARSLPLSFSWREEYCSVNVPIPGIHNGYNAAAALSAVLAAGLPFHASAAALQHSAAAFGRMERFSIGTRDVCLILVKNPVGMDRALDFVAQASDLGGVMMLLNANDPDGRDVSWIWDVQFEHHLPEGKIGVSGVRCHDLALRLYYAGKTAGDLLTDPDHLSLFDRLLDACPENRCLYLLPNYTAMLDLRADLAKRYQLHAFWR
ncbi:MAG: MurT ligase domain-containing protein [Clostridiaceae bacterium]|nr:MurT ligase domain-containing protein [Clostridiaceae bacterium]